MEKGGGGRGSGQVGSDGFDMFGWESFPAAGDNGLWVIFFRN